MSEGAVLPEVLIPLGALAISALTGVATIAAMIRRDERASSERDGDAHAQRAALEARIQGLEERTSGLAAAEQEHTRAVMQRLTQMIERLARLEEAVQSLRGSR